MRTFLLTLLTAGTLACAADSAQAQYWRGYYYNSYPVYTSSYYYSTPVYPASYVAPASYYSTFPTTPYYYPTSSYYYNTYPTSYYYSYPTYRVGRFGRWRW